MKKKIQIFISSTYTDLIEERQAAVSAILKAGHIPAGMELFTAGDESQMETIKRWIDESDVFMLILGGRYGSVEPTTSRSYTELEYDYAVNSGKQYFAVVIEETALEQKVKEKGIGVIETENTKELAAFRKKVLSRTSAFFRDVQDIRLAVYETISDFLVRYDFKGWVSGNEIPDIQSFTEQINKLREENKRLTEDRNALHAGAVFTPSEEREFNHIRQKLDRNVNLHYSLYQQEEGGKTGVKTGKEVYSVNLLSAIIDFVGKGHHRFNKRGIEYLLYEKLGKSHPPAGAPKVKRGYPHESIKDNLVLELQTYGLDRFVEVDTHRPSSSVCEFTDKMYRFVYWLDYNGYAPEIRFELVSTVEEAVPEAPPPKDEIPALSTIKQIDRTLNFKARRNKWRTTEEGVVSAQQEFERLCEELEHEVVKSNGESETFKIDFSREGKNHCVMSAMGVSLSITWNCKHLDTLDDSVLSVKGNKTRFDIAGIQSFTEQGEFHSNEFVIDMNKDLKVVWLEGSSRQPCTTGELVSSILIDLIKAISKRVLHEREGADS